MNGFEGELRTRLLALAAHATLPAPADAAALRGLAERARLEPGVAQRRAIRRSAGPPVERRDARRRRAARNRCCRTMVRARRLAKAMGEGPVSALAPGSRRVALGRVLAFQLQAELGDRLNMLLLRSGADGELAPRIGAFEVSGQFEIGLADHDATLAFASLEDVPHLRALPPAQAFACSTSIRSRPATARRRSWPGRLARSAGSDWTVEHAAYFRAIRLEKTMMTVILLLIVSVAAFNIIASLVMVVSEKRNDIAILRTMGLLARQRCCDVRRAGNSDRLDRHAGRASDSEFCSRCTQGTSSRCSNDSSDSSSSTRPSTTSRAFLRSCEQRRRARFDYGPHADVARHDLPGAARSRDGTCRRRSAMSRTAAWIGLRYLRARRDNRFVGFISVIAMTGIALGVRALIAVLSVMNGFERDLKQRILDVVAHATLEGDGGVLVDWREIARSTVDSTGRRCGRTLRRRARHAGGGREIRSGGSSRGAACGGAARVGARASPVGPRLRRARARALEDPARARPGRKACRRRRRYRAGRDRARQRDSRRRFAAHAAVYSRRLHRRRHVRIRPGPRDSASRRRPPALSARCRGHWPQLCVR